MTNPALEVRNLERMFYINSGMFKPKRILMAVNKISLKIDKGEILGLVGESGSGKSTLSRIMLGLMEPTAGEVFFDGVPIKNLDRIAMARRIQPIFQDPYSSLNPSKSIGSIIGLPLLVHGIEKSSKKRREKVEAIMDLVGLSRRFYDGYPNQLSGGQRQRVSIARALIIKPEVLICDEPTSALDVSVQSQILNLLQDLQKELGLTMLLISHNLAVVQHMATRVAVMYLGEIVEENVNEELFNHPQHPYTRRLLSSILTPEVSLNLKTKPD